MKTLTFEKAHKAFINQHSDSRKGERKARLLRGHGHGETLFLKNVWWPLYGNFEYLHPEYEILDWRGRSYFGDFAYLPGLLKFMIEIKGYGPHVQEMDRQKFCNELNRELYLQSLGFRVVSIAYDDIEQRPDLCRNLLQVLFNRYQAYPQPKERSVFAEKEVLRLALCSAGSISPKEVCQYFGINYRTAVRLLQSLSAKGWMQPIRNGTGQRIHRYELLQGSWEMFD
ncbi:hypothetical protein [Paenibacillus sp. TH7-28]